MRTSQESVAYLAVLPKYRQNCIAVLRELLGPKLRLFASSTHLDPTVKSGIPSGWYGSVKMVRLWGVAFLQLGHWGPALKAEALVVDLNPRSVSAWLFLITRKILKRRTLVWGHINPKAGPNSKTSPLRRTMRRLANGTISYTYSDREQALSELEDQPVWVASNALYRSDQILCPIPSKVRNTVLYVGRLEPEKKTLDLIEALPHFPADVRLGIVGSGSMQERMALRADELQVSARVDFYGWVDDIDELRELYASAICSVSPGFAGLGLTQSAGFGVPQVVSRDERHSPEIELHGAGAVYWFVTGSPRDLARQVGVLADTSHTLPRTDLINYVARNYSAERMAQGLADAMMNATDEKV